MLRSPLRGAAPAALLALALGACSAQPPPDAETVVVLHGLARSPASMAILAGRLESEGYRVVSFGYPSRSEPIEALSDRLGETISECCAAEADDVHFVAHSLGGVVVRSYLDGRDAPHRGRIVMLAPPSQGSEIVDHFADSPLLDRFLGPATLQLGTDTAGIARQLGPIDYDLGIIAGDRSLNPVGSWLIPGPDDGMVGVERTQAEGAADVLVLPATHTFIMNRRDVAREVVHFLRDGSFQSQR